MLGILILSRCLFLMTRLIPDFSVQFMHFRKICDFKYHSEQFFRANLYAQKISIYFHYTNIGNRVIIINMHRGILFFKCNIIIYIPCKKYRNSKLRNYFFLCRIQKRFHRGSKEVLAFNCAFLFIQGLYFFYFLQITSMS